MPTIDKIHLVRLVEETLAQLDIVLCHPTLDVVRGWYRGHRPMIESWVDGKTNLNMTFTNPTVHVKFHQDAGHVELYVLRYASDDVKHRQIVEAATIETLMAQLRLYSTRRDEID